MRNITCNSTNAPAEPLLQCVVVVNFNVDLFVSLCSGIIRRVMIKKVGLVNN